MQKKQRRIGIISALQQEQAGVVQHLEQAVTASRGMRDYVAGNLWGQEVVCVLSRLGKVAAAATTATLIERFNVTEILFTGVAGGAGDEVRIGDLVIAEHLIQHDMDSRPLFPRFEIPLTSLDRFATDQELTERLDRACTSFLEKDLASALTEDDRATFRLHAPRVHRGLIASGDEFIHHPERLGQLRTLLPDLLAVEMEGAAVAQVCFEFGIPFSVVRTISDDANADSAVDFLRFIDKVASQYAFHLIRRFCEG
ncbi:5'-methylthioadenosine/adenosylhomocysteine nucleosidase [Lacisediminimonas profundi]|uniref:5'-methylthioadenosine/adenosylhomocysteine nucleosidase n=1 Tax=Lacisediminimonas profundi TaxID=2603856 RepID=UPI00124B9FEA|nr:5'-methylthioadenosine/adenosylhomocysteine nucleosidase [Lacisediminimonas profundi]